MRKLGVVVMVLCLVLGLTGCGSTGGGGKAPVITSAGQIANGQAAVKALAVLQEARIFARDAIAEAYLAKQIDAGEVRRLSRSDAEFTVYWATAAELADLWVRMGETFDRQTFDANYNRVVGAYQTLETGRAGGAR